MKRSLALLAISLLLLPSFAFAQDAAGRQVEATVERVDRAYVDERGFPQAELSVRDDTGISYRVSTADSASTGLQFSLEPGDRVSLEIVTGPDGTETTYLNDAVRTRGLRWVLLAFVVVTLAVGLTRGLRALVGLALTLGILFGFLLPAILGGMDAVLATVLASLVILAANMHLTHGWTRGTLVAFASAAVGLAFAWVFGSWFVSLGFLSGLTSDEASFLYIEHLNVGVDMTGILLAGVILGAVGALDDIAIAQGEVVAELREANPSLGKRELFSRAMRVGRHHIASIANTLVLAYAGAALPTLLLFWAVSSVSIGEFLNTEAVAEEIVRTLAGTAALILTVPVSTWFAVTLDSRH